MAARRRGIGKPRYELVGHDSVSVDHFSDVHTSPDAMRNALNALPALS
jgi:hypothetical protein